MRRRFARRFSRGGRKSRRVRWLGNTFEVDTVLQAAVGHGSEYLSFWVKHPASTAITGEPAEPSLINPTNEPVDETLVRTLINYQAQLTVPGTAGVAPLVELGVGLIPFMGGDQPDYYDFAVFQNAVSLVSPPSPFVDSDDPWIIRNVASNASLELLVVDTGDAADRFTQSRAMRKLPAGMGILCIVGVVAVIEPDTLNVTIRMGGDVRLAMKSGFSV